MRKASTFEIHDQTFNTQSSLKMFIQSILHGSGIELPVSNYNFEFLSKLLDRHPRRDEKVGVGIKSFIVRKDIYGRTKCFWIVRLDGTETEFSYDKCIKGNKVTNPLKLFYEAARVTIDPQIEAYRESYIKAYKDSNGKFPCEKTGKMLSRKEENVDHIPPLTFKKIVENFLEKTNHDLSSIGYSGFGDGEVHKKFMDESLKSEFATYHMQVARLRVISRKENLTQPKKYD